MSQELVSKIKKLLAKAESTNHPEEAETFAAKAHEMLRKHSMSLLDLGLLDEEDPVGILEDDRFRANSSAGWRQVLAAAAARYYGCRVVFFKRGSFTHWSTFGRESARATFEVMYPYLDKQVKAQSTRLVKEGHYPAPASMFAYKEVAQALADRLVSLANLERSQVEGNGINELVPVDLLDDAIGKRFSRLRSKKFRHQNYGDAARDAAAQVNLAGQMSGRGSLQLK